MIFGGFLCDVCHFGVVDFGVDISETNVCIIGMSSNFILMWFFLDQPCSRITLSA